MGKSTAPGEDGITYSLLRLVSHVPDDAMDQIHKIQAEETHSAQSVFLLKLEKQINLSQIHQAASENDLEKQQLHDSLIISSTDLLDEQQGENCCNIAHTLIISKIKVNVDIKSAVRIDKNSSRSSRRMLIKLANPSDLIQSAAKQKTNLYINECLTKQRGSLFRLRKIRKLNPGRIKQCYTRNGTIIVKKESGGKRYEIKCDQQLLAFFSDCGISENLNPTNASTETNSECLSLT
ncbi:uncharacterized protein [Procambarus clarkii]|uniref:uncharacterized protein n=1 Tax=Procambarus clarkii TaxID=6728 RepID=UPI0037442EE0